MSVRTTDPTTKKITEEFVGCVLGEYEENGHHDSYGHALVWDDEKGVVRTVSTWSTAYYSSTSATVDATPDVIEKAYCYAGKIMGDNMIKDFLVVGPGKNVKSLTTRGKAKGAIGTVVRFENSKFDSAWAARYNPTKVAVVKVTDPNNVHFGRNVWVAPDRLEVTDELTDDVKIDLRYQAVKIVRRQDFVSLFHGKWGSLYQPAALYR
jgi:hypothetical protein